MDKDKILDNNKQCENVEYDSESKQNVHDDCVERILKKIYVWVEVLMMN